MRPRSDKAIVSPPPEPRARLYWKATGRAYGDFRAWSAWGGRLESLISKGERLATTSSTEAAILFGQRLEELRAAREKHPNGRPSATPQALDRLAPYIAHHILCKQGVSGTKRSGDKWIAQCETWLVEAARYFASRDIYRLAEITTVEVQAWLTYLSTDPARSLGPETQLKMLNALGNLFRRAVSEGRITANPVSNLMDKPSGGPSPTAFLESPEAALFLEACRLAKHHPGARASRCLYALVATYLLTGARKAEVTGLLITDIDFENNEIRIRPNRLRPNLKTAKKAPVVVRDLPMPPQLADILSEYLSGPDAPVGPLLFPGTRPDRMIDNFDHSLDWVAEVTGFPKQFMRTRLFRTTWVSARLQCTDGGEAISVFTVAREAGHSSLEMVQKVYGRLPKIRPRGEHVEFRWEDYKPTMGDRLHPVGIPLSERWLAVLEALPAAGSTAKAWERAAGVPSGTFCYIRDRLLQLGLIERDGSGRGAVFRLTHRGAATLRVQLIS